MNVKNILKTSVVAILVILSPAILFAQSTVLDGLYIKEHTPERKVIPYPHLREADVMWSTRIWRVLDLREKINQPLYYPTTRLSGRTSLSQVIIDAILKDGTITAYSSFDDEFKQPLTKAEVKALLEKSDTTMVEDINTGEMIPKVITTTVDDMFGQIKKFRLKEDWFFEKQRSVLDVRIIGIAPVIEIMDENGNLKGENPLFWIYFPEARYVFANNEVYNLHSDAERRTFEDIFWKRLFGSYVYKQSNVYDRLIKEYSVGMESLLESERIKDEIFLLEHDLWEF